MNIKLLAIIIVNMALHSGNKLGPYEVLSFIGAGGMGEVYRAKDTRLARDVAIKVLPPAFSGDTDRVSRFEQEARAAGKLNHPNILTIYDIGSQNGTIYLVSELLEGEVLRNLLSNSAIPYRKAMELASQIARGLAAAHEKGIVHRDLKPENLFVTRDGRVKILDFGLAKLTQPESTQPVTQLPTTPGTEPGVVLGTLGYMSPEQLRGKPADQRSDIFSFGAILFEMITGKRAFYKETPADTISAILHQDPPEFSANSSNNAPAIQRMVQHCLEKDPENRFQSMRDIAFDLETLSGVSVPIAAPVAGKSRRDSRTWAHLALTILLAIALVVLHWVHFQPRSQNVSMVRAFIPPPENSSFQPWSELGMALSPDGKYQAFVALTGGKKQLWIRALSETSATLLPGTEGATYPFWSPDSRHIGFFAYGKLKITEMNGSSPSTISDAPNARGGTWNQDGMILFSPEVNNVLHQVAASGGQPKPVRTVSAKALDERWPVFLPDGKHYLYVRREKDVERELWIGQLGSSESHLVTPRASNAAYVSPGYLLFSRDGFLMAQRFDAKTNHVEGEPFTVMSDRISYYQVKSLANFSVSKNGVLSYLPQTNTATQLIWVDRTGKTINAIGEKGYYLSPRLSPDGKNMVLLQVDPETLTSDVWTYDIVRKSMSRFTFNPGQHYAPYWSPDGTSIFFSNSRGTDYKMYQNSLTGAEKIILNDIDWIRQTDCSSDGKFLAYLKNHLTDHDIWMLPLEGDKKPFPYLQTPYQEWDAQFSPDNKWIAYTSNESGKREVYVQSFPRGNGKWQISTDGGLYPRWRSDGKELFYSTLDGKLIAISVQTSPTFNVGSATPLFPVPNAATYAESDDITLYDVSADGQHFLLNAPAEAATPSYFVLALNWTDLLQHHP